MSCAPAPLDAPPIPEDPEDDVRLGRYARLLVEHAVGLRAGDRLDVGGEIGHRALALAIGDAAYAAGASQVRYRLVDPSATAQLIRQGSPEQIARYHLERQAELADALRARGALLFLEGRTAPGLIADLRHSHPAGHRLYADGERQVTYDFQRWAIDHRLCPVTMAVCPTPAWSRRVFPELAEDEAYRRLWDLVFRFTFSDRDDGLERAARETRRLVARASALDALEIRELHITGGGNDLVVGLSERSRFVDAELKTADGRRFLFNVPSFEVFTTPDRRRTEGVLVASRPVCLQGGIVVEGLELEFRAGRIADFRARREAAAFGRWLDVDDGARFLGEVALVGRDSLIARSATVFEQRLLDENAAAHAAVGCGYLSGLRGGEGLTANELDEIGYNRSAIHVDVPFGTSEVDVVATVSRRGEVPLLEKGLWPERLTSGGHNA